jgi:DNA polymerase beta
MISKDLIISKLENLKVIYQKDPDKKWGLRALSIAINSLKKYDGEIKSGDQLKNDIKGIGEKISKRIDEIIETGTLTELEDIPEDNSLNNLLLITGVGLVRANKWISMGIKTVDDVNKAIKEKKIKSTHHIDVGLKYYEDFQKRIPKDEIDKMYIFLKHIIQKIDSNLIFEICGSYRRGLLDSGDIDILISHPKFNENISEEKFLDKIVKNLKKANFIIDHLTAKGDTKFMGVCKLEGGLIGRRIDIRMVDYKSFYTSLLYFTGSKDFNVNLRNIALAHNYTLNEYGLTNLSSKISTSLNSEEEIFEIFKIPYVKPEDRK